MAGLALIGTAVSVIGSVVGAVGQYSAASDQAAALRQQAVYQQNIANYNKQIDYQQAQQERAVAQRASMEQQQLGKRRLSTLQAYAAASGGGASDPTIISLASDVAGTSEYAALMQTYKGEQTARNYEAQGNIGVYAANANASGLNDQANVVKSNATGRLASGIISGVGGIFGDLSKNYSPYTPSYGSATDLTYSNYGFGYG